VPDSVVKKTKNGRGVFANRNFLKGETILTFGGEILDWNEIDFNSYEDKHCLQIGEKTYLGPSGNLDDFVNHSCAPNSGVKTINRKLALVAIRNIKRNEEIAWDYSTCIDEAGWKMTCWCGDKHCRKIIESFKYLPKKTQKKYLKLSVVAEFIKNKMK
jgi:SET domain-containing protein